MGGNVRARDAEVAAALGDTGPEDEPELEPKDIAVIEYPRARRPCWAFGVDLKVALGRIPIPGIELGNVVDPSAIGPHRFANGYFSISSTDPRGAVDDENNGLVYTCRGGFIDVAHVRGNADSTIALASALGRALETGATLELPPQGATRRILLRPVAAEMIQRYGHLPLAVAAGQWAAFQLAVWHEIATFYGYGALPYWEKISAFSPEDLYSNELGLRLAGAIALAKGARSDLEYDMNMDAWIEQALKRLDVVPVDQTRAALQAVDGAWWDSTKRIPDWTLVRRRQFETGPLLRPWRLEDASPGSKGAVTPLARCRDAAEPLVLQVADAFAGMPFRDYLTAEFQVDDALVRSGFPLQRGNSRRITEEDFPVIISAIREETVKALGAGADRP